MSTREERPGYLSFHVEAYNPRLPKPTEIKIDDPPREPEEGWARRVQEFGPIFIGIISLAAMLYLALSGLTGGSAIFFIPTCLAVGLGGILTGFMYWNNHKKERVRIKKFQEFLEKKKTDAAKKNEEFLDILNKIDPSARDLEKIIQTQRHLWERQPDQLDDNFLKLRIGVEPEQNSKVAFKLPSVVEREFELGDLGKQIKELPERYSRVIGAPGIISLEETQRFGICGKSEPAHELAYAMIMQLAVHHSPEFVRILVFTSRKTELAWFWTGWLPHLVSLDPNDLYPSLTADAAVNDQNKLAKYLEETLDGRREKAKNGTEKEKAEVRFPHLVVILDYYDGIVLPIGLQSKLMKEGAENNIFVIKLAPTTRSLGSAIRAYAEIQEDNKLFLTKNYETGHKSTVEWEVDTLSREEAEKLARKLAPLEVEQTYSKFELPNKLNFYTDPILAWEKPDPQQIAERWQKTIRRADLRACVGLNEYGLPMIINLDDREDAQGVHGILAGMPGAGKGVWLTSFITSLARNNHPNRLNFILTDFKGGNTFNAFAKLPHTVALAVDNMDDFDLMRFLISIEREISRRTEIIQMAQQKFGSRIQKIRNLEKIDPDNAFPFLLVIIDEYAELARTGSQLLDKLAYITQQGRSVGVFLLLSMQTTDKLNENIRKNARYGVALKMGSPGDSKDVIQSEVAATISGSTRGRGYFAYDKKLTLFQTANLLDTALTKPRNDIEAKSFEDAQVVLPIDVSWRTPQDAITQEEVEEDLEVRDVDITVQAYIDAVKYVPSKQFFMPWKPRLSPNIYLSDLMPECFDAGKIKARQSKIEWLSVPFGREDKYWEQQQPVLKTAFAQGKHLQLLGNQNSGANLVLLSIILALAATHEPQDLSFLLIDFGSTLRVVKDLPHGVKHYKSNEYKDIEYAIDKLRSLLEERIEFFANLPDGKVAANLGEFREFQQANGIPADEQAQAVFLIIENYTAWSKNHPDFSTVIRYKFQDLVQRGATYGIYIILTAERFRDVASGDFISNFQTIHFSMDASDLPSSVYHKDLLKIWKFQARGLTVALLEDQKKIEPMPNYCEFQAMTPGPKPLEVSSQFVKDIKESKLN